MMFLPSNTIIMIDETNWKNWVFFPDILFSLAMIVSYKYIYAFSSKSIARKLFPCLTFQSRYDAYNDIFHVIIFLSILLCNKKLNSFIVIWQELISPSLFPRNSTREAVWLFKFMNTVYDYWYLLLTSLPSLYRRRHIDLSRLSWSVVNNESE
jgi:hypothetical protein